MSKYTIMAAAAVACLVVALAGDVTSAGAATFTLSTEPCNGLVINLCWVKINSAGEKEVFELTGKQSFTVAKKSGSGNIVFKGTISEEKFTIECEAIKQGAGNNEITQSAPLSASGSIAGTLIFEGCKLTAPAALAKKCSVPTSKETKALTGTDPSVGEIKLVPEAGESSPFIELEFKNNGSETCPSTFKTGLHAITGFQVLDELNPEVPEETKGVEAVAKSGLKLAGVAAELTGAATLSLPGLGDEIVLCNCA